MKRIAFISLIVVAILSLAYGYVQTVAASKASIQAEVNESLALKMRDEKIAAENRAQELRMEVERARDEVRSYQALLVNCQGQRR